MLVMMGLPPSRPRVTDLSGGERAGVAWPGPFLKPKVLLLDRALSNLEPGWLHAAQGDQGTANPLGFTMLYVTSS
jgi:ABC-type sugar transport system ATPase subunit